MNPLSANSATAPAIDALLAGEWEPLRQLLTGNFPQSRTDGLSPQQLPEQLQTLQYDPTQPLLDQLRSQCDPGLDSDSYALACFADQWFNNVQKNSRLHPEMQRCLDIFRPAALRSLCRQRLPWQDADSPLNHLPGLLPALCGWQPELGRAAERFLQSLQPLLRELAGSDEPDQQAKTVEQLDMLLKREQQRVKKLETRLRDAETGQLHARHARQLSAKTLNQQMGGKKLPAAISHFLQGPWRESMQLTLLSEGKDSQAWRKILRLTETLIWSFQPIDAEESEQALRHLYDSISELSDELRATTVGLHHSSALDSELARVEAEHLKILKGEALDYQPFDLIDNTDPLVNPQVSVSNGLLKNVSQLEQDQWFLYREDTVEKRLKLCIKLESAHQLLFTNFLGIKAEQFSFEEFAYMLSSKIVVPLNGRDRLRPTGEKMLQTLLQRLQQHQEMAAREKALAAEHLRREEEAREAAREKARQEAEAHARAAEEARRKEQLDAQQREQEREQRERSELFSRQLEAMRSGARLSFRDNDGAEQTCRLAAILQSTGEYVFVDRSGVKQLAATRDRLIELLMNNNAKIIDLGSDFESTLEQVVNGLRTRKKP